MAFKHQINALVRWDQFISHSYGSALILAVIMLCTYFYFLLRLPVDNPISADTMSYLTFSPSRTIGYPVFLAAVKYFVGDIKKAIYIQWTFYCFSSLIIAYQLMKITRSFVLGGACLVGLAYNPVLINLSFELITESLFMSLLMLGSVAVIQYLKHRKISVLAIFGGILGLLVLIRPSAYGILIGALGFFFLYKLPFKHWGAALLPTASLLVMGALAQYVQHGFFSTQSFLGHNLFGKVAFTIDETIHTSDPQQEYVLQHMAKEMKPIQKALRDVSDLQSYYMLATPYYDYLRYPVLSKLTQEHKSLAALKNPDSFYKDTALTAIRQKPVAYIKDVFLHYGALWCLLDLKTTAKKEIYNQLAQRIQSDLPPDMAKIVPFSGINKNPFFDIFVYGVRVFLSITFAASLWFLGLGIRRRISKEKKEDILLGLGVFAACSIHASFFIIASIQAGLPRYALALWSLLYILICCSLASLKQRMTLWHVPHLA